MSGKQRFPAEVKGPAAVTLNVDQRYETLVSIYKFQFFATFRRVGERYGWEAANEIIDEMAAEAVPMIAEGYKRKFGLPGEGVPLVSQVLSVEFQAEGSDCATLVENEDEAEYTVLCGLGAALQSGRYDGVEITDGMCTKGCWLWTQQVADTVEDDLEVDRPEWMGDGAPRCRFTIRRGAKGAP